MGYKVLLRDKDVIQDSKSKTHQPWPVRSECLLYIFCSKKLFAGGRQGCSQKPRNLVQPGSGKKKKNLPNLRTPKASPMAQCKESTCHAGDSGLIPGSGRCPGEGNGNPLQYSCLGSPKDRGAWQATVHGVTELNMNLENEYPHTHSTRTLNPATHLIRDYQYHNLI